jgi:hypothetical protein
MTDEVQEQAFKDLMAELEAKRWTPLMNSDDVSSLSFNENALEGEGFPFSYENSLSLFTHRFKILQFFLLPIGSIFAHLSIISLSAHVFSFRGSSKIAL